MFCYQCEQTVKGTGCTSFGVCGKDPEIATLQDLLVYTAKGISQYAHRARGYGAIDQMVDEFILEALFTTVTNVNFTTEDHVVMLKRAGEMIERAKKLYIEAAQKKGENAEILSGAATWSFKNNIGELVKDGAQHGIEARKKELGEDRTGLEYLIIYGLKGMAAYADHAKVLKVTDNAVYGFFHEALNFLTTAHAPEEYLGMSLKVGEMNYKVMEMLDRANTSTYGHPVPTKVKVSAVKGKAILVTGHDLLDLEELLKQTQGKGINIYTHGEMLPCHGYPELKKYPHLVGNWGSAWQNQQKEFPHFPGPMLFTTNCIQKPADSYKSRVFTTGLVGWPGCTHITNRDFSAVIKSALTEKGFEQDEPVKEITVGFGRNAVMSVAGKVIDAVKAGQIKHFYLIGGCDGAKPGRNYYTEFAEKAPKDTVILTLACGKYRFNKLEFGDIGGIPRLLDVGQCNDSYSAIQIALALSKAFNTDVNSLPLSMIISWYEQKAVAVLLTLLSLGVKNIRLGPTLPAFVTPPVLNILVEKFSIKPITTVDEDLRATLAK